ncbi:MAG: DUF6596 domain-containing protein [Acidimicrobiales bacterium]
MRVDLCDEGVRLAGLVVDLLPEEPEPMGLAALLYFQDSRRWPGRWPTTTSITRPGPTCCGGPGATTRRWPPTARPGGGRATPPSTNSSIGGCGRWPGAAASAPLAGRSSAETSGRAWVGPVTTRAAGKQSRGSTPFVGVATRCQLHGRWAPGPSSVTVGEIGRRRRAGVN